MDKKKEFVSFVIYLHNDEDRVSSFLNGIFSYIESHFENYELICVDDGSNDRTVELIKEVASISRSITILEMGFFQGLELAMNAGVDVSIGDFVYEFDSIDDTYSLDVIINIFEECVHGNDIVLACPDKNRSIGSSLFYKIYNSFSKTNYDLRTDTFRILSRRAINRVKSMSNVLPYRKAVYANCGLIMKSYIYNSKTGGWSKANESYRLGVAVDALVLYTNIAYKLAAIFSGFMFLLTVGISIYALIIRIQGIPVAGWTSMVLVICLGFFGLSFLLSIITKYTELILRSVFMQRKYIVKSIERITR